MQQFQRARALATGLASWLAISGSAVACQNTGSFDRWLAAFKQEAAQQGISQRTISAALDGMTLDPGIIARDRGQRFFSQSFIDVVAKLATSNRISSGRAQMQKYHAIFERAEQEYGVPPSIIAAFWALESDFGVGMGNLPVLRSLATLAYDCRRSEMFRSELLDALRIVDRGDLTPSEMIGSWAGELGQTQFLPSHYFKYAVDYDGNGKRNLLRSIPDIIGSTANFLAGLGWQRGQPWLDEVHVPPNMAWEEADLTIQHPRSYWAKAGVVGANNKPLPADSLPASLHLPMGRHGPAFLAYENFQAILKWNQALNYATTVAYLAHRIEGVPSLNRDNTTVATLNVEQVKELQGLLNRYGYQVGEPDGKLGISTRSAVKQAQLKFGLPADSYPTSDLIERLRRR
jgi:lytic murein transglycosylase